MPNDALSKFDLWYFTQFGSLPEFGIEQHRAGALAAWTHFHTMLTEVTVELQQFDRYDTYEERAAKERCSDRLNEVIS